MLLIHITFYLNNLVNFMKKIISSVIFCLLLVPYSSVSASENEKLTQLFDKEWTHRLDTNPLLSRSMGKEPEQVTLSDISPSALKRQNTFYKSLLEQLNTIDVNALSNEQAVNYQIFKDQVLAQLTSYQFGMHQTPFNSDSGFYSGFSRAQNSFKFDTTKDYQDYLDLLKSWKPHVQTQIAHMQSGLDRGFTQPKIILNTLVERVRSYQSETPEKSLFYKPFLRMPDHFTPAQKEQFVKHAREVIDQSVNHGYSLLADFFEKEYVPNARNSIAAYDLPDGKAFYKDQIRYYTTLDLTADEIHQIGLNEVKRIRSEMAEIIKGTGFKGDFAEFLTFLRTDPQFYAKTEEELLSRASRIAKRMDAKLPQLFKHLPRTPYGVEPVPAQLAPNYTTGRYVRSPRGSTQPGYYWVNTYALDKRPLYELEALTLHEAVPGHHLQIALSQELEDLPPFRQYSYISAFGEGWGLYSEWLGLETGFYTDPYSNFGRLTYEMWRAVRLVVDTGMHAKGWTREEAVEYLASNTALSLHNVNTEIDRYISWPAQALSYKLGELTIKRLRKEAENKLGKLFDIRDFHYEILIHGAVPLNVLEQNISNYIESTLSNENRTN